MSTMLIHYFITFPWLEVKCCFTPTNVPNSWLSALFLQQIKDDWNKADNKITSKELNSVRQTLLSTYNHFKKQLKHVIKPSEFIQLDFYCKAAVSHLSSRLCCMYEIFYCLCILIQFLIKRSSGSDPGMKRRVQDQIFPIWGAPLWTKIKTSFDLKVTSFANVYNSDKIQLSTFYKSKCVIQLYYFHRMILSWMI